MNIDFIKELNDVFYKYNCEGIKEIIIDKQTYDNLYNEIHFIIENIVINTRTNTVKITKESEGIFVDENFEWQVGDIVEAWDVRGKVKRFIDNTTDIAVEFENDCGTYIFYRNGYGQKWHKTPTLKFISRPKKLVKKIYYIITYSKYNKSLKLELKCTNGFSTIKEAEIILEEFKQNPLIINPMITPIERTEEE